MWPEQSIDLNVKRSAVREIPNYGRGYALKSADLVRLTRSASPR
jgi:hypothetical protein